MVNMVDNISCLLSPAANALWKWANGCTVSVQFLYGTVRYKVPPSTSEEMEM